MPTNTTTAPAMSVTPNMSTNAGPVVAPAPSTLKTSPAPNMSTNTGPVVAPSPSVITAAPAVADANAKITDINKIAATQKPPSVSAGQPAGAVTIYAPNGTSNSVPQMDVAYWQTQGWNTAPPAGAPAPGANASGAAPAAGATTPAGLTALPNAPVAPDTTAGLKTAADTSTSATATNNAKSEAAFQQYQNTVNSMMNGTFQLPPDQQAQIDNITKQFQATIDDQKVANKNYEAAIGQAGISAGRNMYAPEVELGNVNAAIAAGSRAVADIQTKMATAVFQATEAFKNDDFKMLDSLYTQIQKHIDDQQKVIDDTYNKAKDALTASQQKFTDDMTTANFNLEVAKTLNAPILEADKQLKDYLYTEMNKYPGADFSSITSTDTMASAGEKASKAIQATQQWKDEQASAALDAKVKQANINQSNASAAASYASAAKSRADAAASSGDKVQQALEQQYRGVLVKEVSSRSGSLGTEDAKVVQANHLASLLNQYYDPKTGAYNVPKAQYGELVIGLAGMLSKTGTPTDSQIDFINTATAKGELNKAITYITGSPTNGSTQAVIKNLADSISRQAATAVSNRTYAVKRIQGLAPTDLDPARRAALEKDELAPYTGINGVDAPKTEAPPSTTQMTGPDGKPYNVPNDQVDAFTKAGGHK